MTEPAPTAAHPAGFGRARVLVLGDVMLDRYVYGAVERVSYAAPIPVLAVRREEAMPGGAGNVAGLGATAILIGLVGEDAAGATLAGLLGPGRATTLKTRYIASSQQLLRADQETTEAAAGALAEALLAALPDAARLANLAGGMVVSKVGTAVVHTADLALAAQAVAVHSAEAKIVPLEIARDRVRAWHARGERIGFTNGCFDLLHPGHIALLTQARAACDRLIVAINSDASVRRMKGPSRPIQTETARAIMLASLASVDLVTVFAEDTPIPLLEALRPDVLVKGADYRLDQVVGAKVVQAYGGRVMLADLSPGHSTSGTIRKLTG